MTPRAFASIVRAEINAEFFSDFADLADYRFEHPASEREALAHYLSSPDRERPFARWQA